MRWFCRKHPNKKYKAPGKCPECGRYLVIIQEEQVKKGQSNLLIPEGISPEKFRKLPTPVQTMLKRMSSARQRSAQSLNSYKQTALTFFNILGDVHSPTEQDWHDYFMVRRKQGISDRTLAKEFNHLKKLAETNHYAWPFSKEDVPRSTEDVYAPTFSVQEVEQLIRSWPVLSNTERFYLACSTTWGLRSGELVMIRKRDFNITSILIHKEKREKNMKRLIPEQLKPIFLNVRPSLKSVSSASGLFARICKKAEIKRQRRQSFHSIRHSLTTVLSWALAENKMDPSLIGEWMGWSKARTGSTFGGSPMVGTYRKNEIVSEDPFWLDRLIIPIHPFLKLWEGVTVQEPESE